MLTEKTEKALNEQINEELFSFYLYLSMSTWFDAEGLPGFAHWMRLQADEEMEHAMKLLEYVQTRGGTVELEQINKPKHAWDDAAQAFGEALEHEKFISANINNLVDLSQQEKDHATRSFLQWFVDEQVEEEATADDICQKLKLMQGAPGGLYMIDRELSQRQPEAEEE